MNNLDLKNKNRFVCNYDNCRRVLSKGETKSFPCTSCGHGTMKLVKPKAYCMECEKPIYGNITPRGEETLFYGKPRLVDLTCGACVQEQIPIHIPTRTEAKKRKMKYLRPLSWRYKEENSLENLPKCTSERIIFR